MYPFPNNLVYGFHGTDDSSATAILRHGFQPSTFSGDWLGAAVYFWENDERRAEMWARRHAAKTRQSPAIIRATIDLSRCLDLTQTSFRQQFQAATAELVQMMPAEARQNLRQGVGRRDLDALAINYFMRAALRADGSPRYTCVRAAFQEGDPIFTWGNLQSGIRSLDHIQIGVTDTSALTDVGYRYV